MLVLKEDFSQEIGNVFNSKYNSFDFYSWHFKEFWFNFKIHMTFQQGAVKRLLQKAKNRATSRSVCHSSIQFLFKIKN